MKVSSSSSLDSSSSDALLKALTTQRTLETFLDDKILNYCSQNIVFLLQDDIELFSFSFFPCLVEVFIHALSYL